jgi:hypothetical protein
VRPALESAALRARRNSDRRACLRQRCLILRLLCRAGLPGEDEPAVGLRSPTARRLELDAAAAVMPGALAVRAARNLCVLAGRERARGAG